MREDNMNRSNIIRRLFFLYLLLIILEKISWTIGGMGCNIFIIATPILFLLLLAIYSIHERSLYTDFFDKKLLKYYLLLIIYVLFQFVTIDHTSTMITQYMKGVVEVFVSFIAFLNILLLINYDDSIDFEYASKCFFFLTAFNAMYCVLQNYDPQIDSTFVNLFHSTVVKYGTDGYGKMFRPTGFFIESNFNGPFLVIGIINSLYRIKNGKCKGFLLSILYYGIVLISLVEIIMTLSLTTYIGFFVFLIITFYNSNSDNKAKWVVVIIIALMVGAYFYSKNESLQNALSSKFQTFDSADTLKGNSHYVIAEQALSIFILNFRNAVFGTGYNCLNVFFQTVYGYKVMKAHNFYLQRLCELGIIGFFIIVYYLSILLSQTKKNTKEAILLKTMLIAMLSMNFTYDAFTRNYNIIFLVLAMLIFKDKLNFGEQKCKKQEVEYEKSIND